MNRVANIFRRIGGLAKYVERPALIDLRRKGLDVQSYIKLNHPWLTDLGIKTVLDIGANVGQFATVAHALFPNANIYSFEPLPDCFVRLKERMAGVACFRAFNLGLGDETGTLEFQHCDFAPSSSFLKMTETHKDAFPFTRESSKIIVQIEKLDEVARTIEIADPMLIKIDVQGYEDRVLRGGKDTVARAKVLIAEASFAPLYEGQPTFEEICTFLNRLNFKYVGSLDQLHDPKSGKVLQADSIFIKHEL